MAKVSYQPDGRAPILDTTIVVREHYYGDNGVSSAMFVNPDFATILAKFTLSLIWRASVSTVVPDVTLGKYNEPIRRYLLGLDPLPPPEVAVLAWFYEDSPCSGKSVVNHTMVEPHSRRIAGQYRAHRAILCGFDLEVLAGQRIPEILRSFCLVHSVEKRLLLEPLNEVTKLVRPLILRALPA